jgi:hypothetical protein
MFSQHFTVVTVNPQSGAMLHPVSHHFWMAAHYFKVKDIPGELGPATSRTKGRCCDT